MVAASLFPALFPLGFRMVPRESRSELGRAYLHHPISALPPPGVSPERDVEEALLNSGSLKGLEGFHIAGASCCTALVGQFLQHGGALEHQAKVGLHRSAG